MLRRSTSSVCAPHNFSPDTWHHGSAAAQMQLNQVSPPLSDRRHSDLLKTATALSELQMRFPGLINLQVPRFVVTGMQSAGKSTLVNIFAGRRIAGGIKEQCGTMRPVVFSFAHNARPEGLRSLSLDGIQYTDFDTDTALFDKIDEIMKPLQDARRYIEEPVYVRVEGPACLTLVIEDLPGMPVKDFGGSNKTQCAQIRAMFRKRMQQPQVVPVLVSRLDPVNDTDTLQLTMNNVKAMWGDSVGADVLARAIFFCNGLNFLKDSGTELGSKLDKVVCSLESGKVCSRDRVVFGSLKHQYLEQAPPENVQEDDAYFMTFMHDESRRLAALRERVRIPVGKFLMGTAELQRMLEDGLVECMRKNLASIRSCSEEGLRAAVAVAQRVCQSPASDSLHRNADLFCKFMAKAYAPLATAEYSEQEASFKWLHRECPEGVDGLLKSNPAALRKQIVEAISLPYYAQVELYMDGSPRDGATAAMMRHISASAAPMTAAGACGTDFEDHLLTDNIRSKMTPSQDSQQQHFCHALLHKPLCMGAAMKRSMIMNRFAIMSCSMKEHDVSSMLNAAGGGIHAIRRTDLHRIIHNLTLDNRLTDGQVTFGVRFLRQLFTRPVSIILSMIKPCVRLLDGSPILRDWLCVRIEQEFIAMFGEAAERITTDVVQFLENQNKGFTMGTFVMYQRALSVCRLPEMLVPGVTLGVQSSSSSSSSSGHADPVSAKLMKVLPVVDNNNNNNNNNDNVVGASQRHDSTTQLFSITTQLSHEHALEKYALNEPLKLESLEMADVDTYSEHINALVHTNAQFCNHQVLEQLETSAARHFGDLVRNITSELPQRLKANTVDPVFSDKALLRAATETPTVGELVAQHVACRTLQGWLEAAEILNHQPLQSYGQSPILLVAEGRRALDMIEAKRQASQKNMSAAHVERAAAAAAAIVNNSSHNYDDNTDNTDDSHTSGSFVMAMNRLTELAAAQKAKTDEKLLGDGHNSNTINSNLDPFSPHALFSSSSLSPSQLQRERRLQEEVQRLRGELAERESMLMNSRADQRSIRLVSEHSRLEEENARLMQQLQEARRRQTQQQVDGERVHGDDDDDNHADGNSSVASKSDALQSVGAAATAAAAAGPDGFF